MVFSTYKELKENRRPGDVVFCVRQDTFSSVPVERWEDVKPVQGSLRASYYCRPMEESLMKHQPPRHLEPLVADESHAWDSSWWDIENWIVCDAVQEAEKELEKQMKDTIAKAKERILMMELLLPSMKSEPVKGSGELEVPPCLRRDMSVTFDEVMSCCIGPAKKEQYNGELFTLKDFFKDVSAGGFTDYDGFGDLVVDGVIYDNVHIVIAFKRVMIGDRFEIPFERLEQVFEGHKLEVQWYNK